MFGERKEQSEPPVPPQATSAKVKPRLKSLPFVAQRLSSRPRSVSEVSEISMTRKLAATQRLVCFWPRCKH